MVRDSNDREPLAHCRAGPEHRAQLRIRAARAGGRPRLGHPRSRRGCTGSDRRHAGGSNTRRRRRPSCSPAGLVPGLHQDGRSRHGRPPGRQPGGAGPGRPVRVRRLSEPSGRTAGRSDARAHAGARGPGGPSQARPRGSLCTISALSHSTGSSSRARSLAGREQVRAPAPRAMAGKTADSLFASARSTTGRKRALAPPARPCPPRAPRIARPRPAARVA